MPSLADLPPPPEAHFKYPENGRGTTTGHQGPLQKSGKDPKNRKRPRLSHDISPKPQKSLEDSPFAYFQEEADKHDSARCVFLLWGPRNSEKFTAWAVDVPTTTLESEDLIFVSLAQRYAAELGFWRRWLAFRKFSELKPVTFRLICRSSEKFRVFVEPLDLDQYYKLYCEERDKQTADAKSIVTYEPDGFVDVCQCDSDGEYHHDASGCHYNPEDSVVCPFVERDRYIEQIHRIETTSFLSHYFSYPIAARSQSILDGFNAEPFLYHYRDVRPLRGWKTQTRYRQLNGLYIETTWDPIKCLCIFFGLLICVLVVGRLCWGNWEITFGAGSFFVALPMLVLTALSYYEV